MQCFGISNSFGHLPGLVLPFCNGGTITEHLRGQPSSKKLDMVSVIVVID